MMNESPDETGPMTITRSLLGDAVLAAALTSAGIVGTTFAGSPSRAEVPIDARGFALVVTAAMVLGLHRRWPLAMLAVVTICTSVYLILGYAYGRFCSRS
jgi:hypothetical protein